MSLQDLIEILEEIRDEHGEDVDVRLAYQPNYPLAATIAGVAASEDGGQPVIFVCAGHDTGYARPDLWNELVSA